MERIKPALLAATMGLALTLFSLALSHAQAPANVVFPSPQAVVIYPSFAPPSQRPLVVDAALGGVLVHVHAERRVALAGEPQVTVFHRNEFVGDVGLAIGRIRRCSR